MSEDAPVRLGRAVAAARAELGLKRRELAEAAGLSYPYVAEIENGSKSPSQRAMSGLATALRMTPSELLERAEQIPSVGPDAGLLADSWSPPASSTVRAPQGTPDLETALLVAAVTRSLDDVISRWARQELPGLIAAELARLKGDRS